jgi:polyhydroxyalkanoate synthesis regulator protein
MTSAKKQKRRFVKYANRKIHEISDINPYVTMEELLSIVAAGEEVEVTDDVTGENITSFVLARLVYDRCRMDKQAYAVPDLRKLIMSNPPEKKTGKSEAA